MEDYEEQVEVVVVIILMDHQVLVDLMVPMVGLLYIHLYSKFYYNTLIIPS